jgi:hypothetical protein
MGSVASVVLALQIKVLQVDRVVVSAGRKEAAAAQVK